MKNQMFIFVYKDTIQIESQHIDESIPNVLFQNINKKWMFGQKAEIAKKIWVHFPTYNLSYAFLNSLNEEERFKVINTFIDELCSFVGMQQKITVVLPKMISEFYGGIFNKINKENIQFISFSDLHFLAYSSKETKGEYGLYFYDGDQSTELVLTRRVGNTTIPLKAMFCERISNPSFIVHIVAKLCEWAGIKISQISDVKIKTNRLDILMETVDIPLISKEKLNNQLEFFYEEVSFINKALALQVECKVFDVFNEKTTEYLIKKLPQSICSELIKQVFTDFNKFTEENKEYFVSALMKILSGEEMPEAEFLAWLKNVFLQRPDRTYKVGIVSPFSYGKSTLLNAILGKNLLKDNILAETAVVTYVGYSSNYRLYTEDKDSIVAETCSNIDHLKEEIRKYTSVYGERYVEGKTQNIYVSVPYDTRYPMIEWIDTPGLFTHHEYHEELTDHVVKELDYLIFLIDPEKIGEANFLRKIEEYTYRKEDKSLFVISKRDVFSDNIVETLSQELRRHMPGSLQDAPIFSVSGYFALKYKEFCDGRISFPMLQKDFNLYAEEDGERYSGKNLELHHVESVYELSHIFQLEEYIHRLIRKELRSEVLT